MTSPIVTEVGPTTSLTMREDTVETIEFWLRGDDAPVDITGLKVELVLIPDNGTGTAASINTTDDPSKLASVSDTLGRVGWTPASGDVLNANSPYKAFFWVHTSGTTKYSVPNGEDMTIEVLDDYV